MNARARLAEAVTGYFRELGLSATSTELEQLSHPESVRLVEFAHTPHFGHLGFLRMLAVALDAAQQRRASLLLVLNDHVRSDALPTLRAIPIQRGPQLVSIRFGVPSRHSHLALAQVAPPQAQQLQRCAEEVRQVLAFQASQSALPQSQRKRSWAGVAPLFDELSANAEQTPSLAHWAVRTLLLWCRQLQPQVPVWPLSARALAECLPEVCQRLRDRKEQIIELHNRWSQRSQGWPEWSRVRPANDSYEPFHRDGSPKVVVRQPLADHFGLELRVCGGQRGYWPVVQGIGQLLGAPATERLEVTGSVALWGLGGLEECPASLRVLCQLPPRECLELLQKAAPHERIELDVRESWGP